MGELARGSFRDDMTKSLQVGHVRSLTCLLELWGEHAKHARGLAAERKGTSVSCTAATPEIGNHVKWVCKVPNKRIKN